MLTSGKLQIDPGIFDTGNCAAELEVVIPYSEGALTEAALRRAAVLTAGLKAVIRLVAVHVIPYPLPFYCPTAVHAHLVERLTDLASRCPVSVDPQVVLARYPDEGYRHVLNRNSIVLVGSRKRFWRTREERLARRLARDGHMVVLVHLEEKETRDA
jgi:hypothetical protein